MPRAEPGNPSSTPDRTLVASFFRPGRQQRPKHLFETRSLRHHRPPTRRPCLHYPDPSPWNQMPPLRPKKFFSLPWLAPRNVRYLTLHYQYLSRLQSLILSAQNGFYDDARAVKFDS
jgi:hypothetical protein